jgi:hypothetical protein
MYCAGEEWAPAYIAQAVAGVAVAVAVPPAAPVD